MGSRLIISSFIFSTGGSRCRDDIHNGGISTDL